MSARPLRVLHVVASMSRSAGGPTIALEYMLRALRRRGIDADLVTTDADGPARRLDVPHGRPLEQHGQRVLYFPLQLRRYSVSLPLARWLAASIRHYDVVHTTGLYTFAPLVAAALARRAGIPYVMHPAGTLDTWGIRNRRPRLKRLSIGLVEGPLLDRAAAVHFMTDLERDRACELGRPIRPVVLPVGFDFPAIDRAIDPLPEFARDEGPKVLYLSRIDYMKGVDRLLRAFAAIPERATSTLLLAGDGPAPLVDELRRLALDLGLGDRVRWLGFVQGARKQSLLRHASLFVLPSASENFGIAVLEAMHAGLPVVVTSGVGLASLVARRAAGLVTDGSVESLAAALRTLLGDAALRQRLGHAGQEAVTEELSVDACGAGLETLYRRIVAGESVEPVDRRVAGDLMRSS